MGGGEESTGVTREPRYRPVLLVSDRTARTRGSNLDSLGRPRPPMVANY